MKNSTGRKIRAILLICILIFFVVLIGIEAFSPDSSTQAHAESSENAAVAGTAPKTLPAEIASITEDIKHRLAELAESGEASSTEATEEQTEKAAEEEYDLSDWKYVLVNPWHRIEEDADIETTVVENDYEVDSRVADAAKKMLADCRAAGYSPRICSAFRTYSKQVELFNNDVRKYERQGMSEADAQAKTAESVAIPGTSEHQLGLAMDIVWTGYQQLDDNQANNDTQKWLMENCYKYGFILRYPKDKSDITGIVYEPWHYRYVGEKAAKEMHDENLCLEEWLAKHGDANAMSQEDPVDTSGTADSADTNAEG